MKKNITNLNTQGCEQRGPIVPSAKSLATHNRPLRKHPVWMKKIFTFLLPLLCLSASSYAQKELIFNTTGFGFSRTETNGIANDAWQSMQKFASLTYNGQDASITAVRFYVEWREYEPTDGNYQGAKLQTAVNTILALKPGMKIALHFNYNRFTPAYDPMMHDEDIAKTIDGTNVQIGPVMAWPSIYSQTMRQKFYNYVDHALSQLTSVYNKILYVQMGNSRGEEYGIPTTDDNGPRRPAFYEAKAVAAWRTEYLPCRYPGQTTVTWDGNTHTIANAPVVDASPWQGWTSEHAKEYHRFGAWGLMRMHKEFRDVVKAKSSSLKVIYFPSDFGSQQGNFLTMHNATLPMAEQEFDGIYSSEGEITNMQDKIMALDVMKGTNPNKIASIEFDPFDCGKQGNASGINPAVPMEWMPRAYKHGADYIHLAMHFDNAEIDQLAPVLANIRANYVNGTYTSPARQAPVNANILPNAFTMNHIFMSAWTNQGGNVWATSDVSPKSVNMVDNNYWENIWNCTPSNPCSFSMSTSATSTSVSPGASVTLNGSCSGQCSGVSYSWSGNGISGTANSVTFNAPSTAGTYTYTLTGTKSGCSNQTSNINITVNPPGGGGTTCVGLNDNCSGNSSEITSTTVTVSSSGSYEFKLTYRAHEVSPSSTGRIRINGGSWQNITLPYAAPNVYVQNTIGNFNLNSGSNTIELNMVNGHQCYRQLCVTGGSGGCSTPAAPSLSASPSTITTSGGSSTLTATGCSGGTIDWSDGLGSGTSKTVSPSATKTYTATCSIGGCTSAAASVTVNVNISGGGTPVCVGLNDNCSGNSFEITSSTVTVSSSGSYEFKLTYRAHEVSPSSTGRIRINGGSWQNITLPYAAPNVYVQTVIGNFNLNSGNNTVELNMVNGHQCYRQLCVQPAGNPAILGIADETTSAVKQLAIYPNPAKGVFETSFYLEKGKRATIVISDMQGRTIHRQIVTGQGFHREKINVNNKATGTLLVQLIKDNGIEVKKLSVIR